MQDSCHGLKRCVQIASSCSAFTALRELHLCHNGINLLHSNISRQLPESLEVFVQLSCSPRPVMSQEPAPKIACACRCCHWRTTSSAPGMMCPHCLICPGCPASCSARMLFLTSCLIMMVRYGSCCKHGYEEMGPVRWIDAHIRWKNMPTIKFRLACSSS